jgi:hypothetical protein
VRAVKKLAMTERNTVIMIITVFTAKDAELMFFETELSQWKHDIVRLVSLNYYAATVVLPMN